MQAYPIVERRENGEEFITEMSFSIIFHRLSDFSPTFFGWGRGIRVFTTAPNASSFRQKALEGGGGEDYEPRATGDSPSLGVSSDDGNNLFRRGLTTPLTTTDTEDGWTGLEIQLTIRTVVHFL
ncbi:hypothetical protein TNCV_4376351 [Trichonephila clavipes]|nr:hypothetical protein TNCV_4376351 [Trichonephila clavipes]